MKDRDTPDSLVEERQALDLYMAALLTEPAAELTPVVAEPVIAEPVIAATLPETAVEVETQQQTAKRSEVEGRPAWAESSFQALLFRVAGLTLAVPLSELSGVQELDHTQLTPMPGNIAWYLGLTEYRERNVPVVDAAQLVLPEKMIAALGDDPLERVGHVVYIDNGLWGIGCQEVAEVLTLTPEQVSWRSSRTSRRWLAGTVLEQMCALIDPPAFAEMLASGISVEEGDAVDSDS